MQKYKNNIILMIFQCGSGLMELLDLRAKNSCADSYSRGVNMTFSLDLSHIHVSMPRVAIHLQRPVKSLNMGSTHAGAINVSKSGDLQGCPKTGSAHGKTFGKCNITSHLPLSPAS